jgi:4-amino-4-deoxy-L-arabinose transferase-like glycosyltransferase
MIAPGVSNRKDDPPAPERSKPRRARKRRGDMPPAKLHSMLWLLALPVLLIGIGRPEVTRTQEARVLEVARQMLGRPAIDWMIPKINGDIRLQKPPVTYWMSAAAFEIGGVNESVGRIPTAVCGWLTLAVVYCAARWLFNERAGVMSAACLLGSYYFARHARLAETDVPATLFVTLGIYALWRGAEDRSENAALSRKRRTWVGWMHLGAFATGMSVVCKGAPGAFPIVFLLAFSIVQRSAAPIRRFFFSGSFVTLAVIALPWFLFAGAHEGWKIFLHELRNVEAGTDHGAPVYQYIPWLIVGTLPWTVVALAGVIVACRDWKRNARSRGLLIWLAAIALPLCFIANKQSHYLLPLMPVLMIFAGWMIDRWDSRRLIRAVYLIGIAVPPIVTLLIPQYTHEHTREIAQLVHDRYGDAAMCFYGPNASIPLCFNLRKSIPTADDAAELESMKRQHPWLVIITIAKDKRPATAPTGATADIFTVHVEDQVWSFYRLSSATGE